MAFKMKGFGGFGNSPVKQITIKPLTNPKFKKFEEDKKQTRKRRPSRERPPNTNLGMRTKPKRGPKAEQQKLGRLNEKKTNLGRLKNTVKRVTNEAKQEFTKQVKTNNSKIKIPKGIKRPPQPKKHKLKGLTGFEYDTKKIRGGLGRIAGNVYRAGKKAIDANKKFYKGAYNYFTKR